MRGLNGKAEPFLTPGGGAVPNNDGLVAALLRYLIARNLRITFQFSMLSLKSVVAMHS